MNKFIGGERVTRQVYMDDGTWMIKGDECLKHSPLKRGVVLRRNNKQNTIIVRWNDGSTGEYLDHGIDLE